MYFTVLMYSIFHYSKQRGDMETTNVQEGPQNGFIESQLTTEGNFNSFLLSPKMCIHCLSIERHCKLSGRGEEKKTWVQRHRL